MKSHWLLLAAASCLFTVRANCAQESSSRGEASATVTGPAAALRDALVAACSHDEVAFRRFLTERNSGSFNRLTVAARTELMKRFVLLADPGKPAATANAAGRPIVSCATPYGTAEIQLGGTDLHDAVAFLPVDLREASDPDTGAAHHVLFGMVRENGNWKVLSIGLLLLDLPSLEVEWDQAEISTSEGQALVELNEVAAAVEKYRKTYSRLPDSLEKLGPAKKNTPTAEAAGLLDVDLAAGRKNGYTFRFVIVGANDVGAPAKYELAATPSIYGRTGKLSYFRDVAGVTHAGDHAGAIGDPKDPQVK
ncbi:MAG TPA: hypothetical protein VFP96_04945 [Candidatus Acidoferrum sp.]|nr:hypothetical protein [Candidatus Acidoferrum sp.]